MSDPAEIIAAAMLRPPPRPDTRVAQPENGCDTENGLDWEYRTMMAHPAAPAVARHVADAAVQDLGDAGWMLVRAPGIPPVRSSGTLPSPGQMRNWLALHEWKEGTEEGPAGTLWFPPVRGRGVGIPRDGDDPDLITGAIERIAARMAMTAAQVLQEMMLYG